MNLFLLDYNIMICILRPKLDNLKDVMFKVLENKPFEVACVDHNKWLLSYLHQYIDLYQVVDAHAIDQVRVRSEIYLAKIFP